MTSNFDTRKIIPEVGMGATAHSVGDMRAYTIVAVSEGGRKLTLQRDKVERIDDKTDLGHQRYKIECDPQGRTIIARQKANGEYYSQFQRVEIGARREFVDFSS